MYFLFSGEGPTDLGSGLQDVELCEGKNYLQGPLALFADKIAEQLLTYSLFDLQCCGFVSKKKLTEEVGNLKPLKKFRIPRGEMRYEQGTKYFRNNARVLAMIAQKIATEKNDEVIAILFRDSDRKHSSGSTEWEKKRDSILNGFQDENFQHGVPMIPKPVSEAWILCAIYRKENPNRNCNDLENRTHGKGSEHTLKYELEKMLKKMPPTRELLNEKIQSGEINVDDINLPSFNRFKERLTQVLNL
jgi:hypothetical protein